MLFLPYLREARARSALARVLRKLRATMANLLGPSKKRKRAMPDYDSLTLLSNSSRIQAIQACDQLSRRLQKSSSSRHSVAASTTSSGSAGERRKRRYSYSGSAASSVKSNGRGRRRTSAKGKREGKSVAHRERQKDGRHSEPRQHRQHRQHRQNDRTGDERTDTPKRVSLLTTSSDSTKLGEIPERRPRRSYTSNSTYRSTWEGYGVTPVYPLRPFQSPAKERTFLGLVRRKS